MCEYLHKLLRLRLTGSDDDPNDDTRADDEPDADEQPGTEPSAE